MHFYPIRKVVQPPLPATANSTDTATPNIYVKIAVDVAYLVSQKGETIDLGIYMMDNMVSLGSSNEGSMDLNTVGHPGWLMGWEVVPIDPCLTNLALEITFIQICTGEVFGSPPQPLSGDGYSWLGELTYQGNQSYAIQIKVTTGLNPISYYINWQATVTCQ